MNFWTPSINKTLWQTRLFIGLNILWKVYQNTYADWSLVDSKLIDSTTIPQAVWWIWTKAIWTFAIWTGWITSADNLYNTTIVRDKWYLKIKAKEFYIEYVSYDLWTLCLLQNLEAQVEQLPYLTTSHY